MTKRVVIKSLSEFSTPLTLEKCGYALEKIIELCSQKERYPTMTLEVIKHNHHKMIIDFFFMTEREYEKLKLDFLYRYASSFTWREKWHAK